MKCPKCGHSMSDDALFCSECGTSAEQNDEKLKENTPDTNSTSKYAESSPATQRNSSGNESSNEDASSANSSDNKESKDEASTEQGSTAATATTTETSTSSSPAITNTSTAKSSIVNKFKALDKKVRYGIIGGAAVAVIVLIAIIGGGLFGGVPTDVAKQAFINQSSLATEGAFSSSYTNDTPYEITEFRIDSEENYPLSAEEQQILNTYFDSNEACTVTCSGKVANESFETEFTAEVAVIKVNGSWQATDFSQAEILSQTTKPLKGVDNMNSSTSSSSSISYSDFTSTLDESNGTYTSTATGTETYTFWFGTDTAQVSQQFTFDPESGWKPQNDIQKSNETTTWNLEGKNFEATGINDMVTSTITLHCSDDNTITADYSIVASIPEDKTKWYKDFTTEGTAAATITHEYGRSDIELTLEDSSTGAAFDGSISGSLGDSYYAHVTTNDAWYTGVFADGSFDETFDHYLNYELTNADAA